MSIETRHYGAEDGAPSSQDSVITFSHDDGEATFLRIYQAHSPSVYGLASGICGPKLAADVTQEVFLQFWQHPGRFDPERGSLRTLLLTMAHYKSVDLIRTENNRRAREHKSAPSAILQIDIEGGALEKERFTSLSEALKELPKPRREAIETAFWGQSSYRETAAVLGQAEGTTKSQIRAGLAQLRLILGEES
jgi:RNA polymerase sigma-70 factor (ECF subfamily)